MTHFRWDHEKPATVTILFRLECLATGDKAVARTLARIMSRSIPMSMFRSIASVRSRAMANIIMVLTQAE